MQLLIGAFLLLTVVSIRCPDGQYSDPNNLCQPCKANCISCQGPDDCVACR